MVDILGPAKVRFSSNPDLQARYAKELASTSHDGPIFFDSARGEPCEIRQFVSDALKEVRIEVNPALPERQTRFLAIKSGPDRFFELILPSGRVPVEWAEFQVTIFHATEMFHHNEAARYVATSVDVDHEVDQYVHETPKALVTGAGMTAETARADGRTEIQYTISMSAGIGFGPRLDDAIRKLLSESESQ